MGELGLIITGLDALTGLPKYRNGGLCIDLGLICLLAAPEGIKHFSEIHLDVPLMSIWMNMAILFLGWEMQAIAYLVQNK